jgi:hypothetical protein
MKVTRLLLLLAFFCLQSNFGLATDSASGFLRPLAGLWIPGNSFETDFGSGIAMSKDGNTVVVGAPGESAAYVYVKPSDGWQTTQNYTAKLTNGRPGRLFGSGVGISGDTIVVSMNDGERGAAFVFEKPEGGWQSTSNYVAMLYSESSGTLGFGAVAIDGDTIVAAGWQAGAQVGVFVKPAGGWRTTTETAVLRPSSVQPGQSFGPDLAISGSTIIVGGYYSDGANSAGSAFIYVKPAGGWVNSTETADLTPSDGFPWEGFGISVSIDGETAVVGAWENNVGAGAAYVFTQPSDGWQSMTETAKLTASNTGLNSWFGYQVAICGPFVAVGAGLQGLGFSYVYVEPNGGWQTTSDFNEELPSPSGLRVSGPFGMGRESLVTDAADGQTSDPSVVLVYGIE